jgi:hypothetical protein
VPIYGTVDAGRGFWKELRGDILEIGLKENAITRAWCAYKEEGDVKVMLGSHVDDVLWACKEGCEGMQKLLGKYTLNWWTQACSDSASETSFRMTSTTLPCAARTTPRRSNRFESTCAG